MIFKQKMRIIVRGRLVRKHSIVFPHVCRGGYGESGERIGEKDQASEKSKRTIAGRLRSDLPS